MQRFSMLLGTLLFAGLFAGAASARAQEGSAGTGQWVSYDAATKTATIKLEAGTPGAKSPFNFNGHVNGEAAIVVPPKSTVVMNFIQNDGTPHSAEIISDKDPMPNMASDPAIPRAYTIKVQEGLPQGGKDTMRFTAPESGTFRIFCGVPGHGLSGMWIRFKVDPNAETASFEESKGAK
jgi:sulfocyanin